MGQALDLTVPARSAPKGTGAASHRQIGWFFPSAETVVESVNERLFDFRACPAFGCMGQSRQIEPVRVTTVLGDLNSPDGLAFRWIWKVDKEQFIEQLKLSVLFDSAAPCK